MEKKRKLKRFVMPSIYVALVAILAISTFATFANMKSVNEEEKINYVSMVFGQMILQLHQ